MQCNIGQKYKGHQNLNLFKTEQLNRAAKEIEKACKIKQRKQHIFFSKMRKITKC
jgi:hypothetical protein